MKFRKARLEDKDLIEKSWREIFAQDDGGHSDFYFQHAYQASQSYLWLSDEGELVSSCQVHTKTLMLNDKPLQVSMIVGLFTFPKYRKQGHMKAFLTQVLDILEHRDLITLIQAYDPNLYLPYGFEPIYHQKVFTLMPEQVPVMSPQGVSFQATAQELFDLYRHFTSHFTGYCRRELSEFTLLQHEIAAQGGRIISVKGESGIDAYATLLISQTEVIIEEMVYLNAHSVLKLLNAITSLNLPIQIHVSAKEDLLKIFPLAHVDTHEYTYARLNDATLFNELYKVNAKKASDAFLIAKKPLWIRENQ